MSLTNKTMYMSVALAVTDLITKEKGLHYDCNNQGLGVELSDDHEENELQNLLSRGCYEVIVNGVRSEKFCSLITDKNQDIDGAVTILTLLRVCCVVWTAFNGTKKRNRSTLFRAILKYIGNATNDFKHSPAMFLDQQGKGGADCSTLLERESAGKDETNESLKKNQKRLSDLADVLLSINPYCAGQKIDIHTSGSWGAPINSFYSSNAVNFIFKEILSIVGSMEEAAMYLRQWNIGISRTNIPPVCENRLVLSLPLCDKTVVDPYSGYGRGASSSTNVFGHTPGGWGPSPTPPGREVEKIQKKTFTFLLDEQ